MAEVRLGNDTPISVTMDSTTPVRANVPDINYIPDYKIAEQERRANETVRQSNEETRQDNEADRIALYEDLLNKLETDYFKGDKGDTGATPSISANANITGGTGTPSVSVVRSGTDEEPILSFTFNNLKGDKGDAGAIKFEIVQTLPTTDIKEDTIYLVPITPDTSGNNYAEYIYVNGAWELLGKIGVQIDLTDYVKNTDYANFNKGGVVKVGSNAITVDSSGNLKGVDLTYAQYTSAGNNFLIDKGTLGNVITGKQLVNQSTLNTSQAAQDTRLDALEEYTSGDATTESEGTSLTLTNTLKAPFDSIGYKGQTSQTGTPTPSSPIPVNVVSGDNEINICGKNLFDKSKEINSTYTSSISTALNNYLSTGKYAVGYTSGASTLSNNANYVSTFTPCVSGTTYTIYNTYSLAANLSSVCFLDANGNIINKSSGWSNSAYTHTATSEEKYIMVGINMNDNGVDYRNYVQIEVGSTSTTYEPYIGNTYPIYLGVENAIPYPYNQTTTTQSGITITDIGDGSLKINGTSTATINFNLIAYNGAFPNGTYTFELENGVSGSCYIYAGGGNSGITGGGSLNKTIQVANNTLGYFIIQIPSGKTFNNLIVKPKMTTGSHLQYISSTPIELCKIGTYQDYIYKDNGSWYLHKEIGKVVLDGSETWGYGGATGVFYTNSVIDYASSNNIPKSNYYMGVNNVVGAGGMSTNNTVGFINQSGTVTPRLYIRDDTYTSNTNDFKTWLGTHNTIVYYVLATPTNTLIEDTTLISQLENIYDGGTYKGTTNINQENNDLAFIIDASTFNNNLNGQLELLHKLIEG